MDHFSHNLADLILEIEAEMRRIDLWESTPPPNEALESLVPFCHDTLQFEQWLQWVFLANIKGVIEGREECPSSSEISPLAEHRFLQLDLPTITLLELLEQFDQLINQRSNELG